MKYYRFEIEKIIRIMVLTCFHRNQLNVKHPFLSYLVLLEIHIYQLMPQEAEQKLWEIIYKYRRRVKEICRRSFFS